MQLSRLSLITLLLTSFSAAISLEETIDARDIVLAKAAGEAVQKRNIEVRTPKPKKVKTGGGGDDDDDDDDDPNSAASVHLNMVLIAGAGAVAVAAMML
ncbi:hypothetical protein EYR41_006852 [Orbilia oligospora]|uniref:Uncharacterized protein n=1 Tax=Orbilia oligospora TaxID=2813651 RepID=A0A8H2HN48_ORBOL|nr:hypothetical protein EYR41_006852 [Orbilia oligospora]